VYINAVREGAMWCGRVQECSECGTQRCEKVPRMERKGAHNAVREGATWCGRVQESSVCGTQRCEKVLDVLVDGHLLLEVG
jgi:hypothetical protein